MYACATLNTSVTPYVCSDWVQTFTFPPLTEANAVAIVEYTMLIWALAWGIRFIFKFLAPWF